MLAGEFSHNMDTKGRIMIPSKLRESLGERFVLTRGLDNCIFIYPMNEWEKLAENISKLPLNSKNSRMVSRFFLSAACECELDSQGRVKISGALIEYAELEKECVTLGVNNRLEVWNKNKWNEYVEDIKDNVNDIAEDMEFDF